MRERPHRYSQYPKLTGLPELPVVVVGMDLSLTSTGLAVYGHGHVYRERIKTGDMRGLRRLFYIRKQVIEFVLAQTTFTEPVPIFIEGYAFAKGDRAHQIGELGGIIRTDLAQFDFDVYTVPPGTLKKFVTADGQAKKPKIVLQLYKRWGIEVDQEDEADAVGLAIMGAIFVSPPGQCIPGHQVEALGKVTKIWGTGWEKY